MKAVRFVFLVATLFASEAISAQGKKDHHNSLSMGIQFPLGDFSNTHHPGAVVAYDPLKISKRNHIAFVYNANIHFYPGKKESVSDNYEFRYGNYIIASALGGIRVRLTGGLKFGLWTGPGIGNYFQVLRFTWAAKTQLNYNLKKDWGLSAQLCYLKQSKANALWSAGISLAYLF